MLHYVNQIVAKYVCGLVLQLVVAGNTTKGNNCERKHSFYKLAAKKFVDFAPQSYKKLQVTQLTPFYLKHCHKKFDSNYSKHWDKATKWLS